MQLWRPAFLTLLLIALQAGADPPAVYFSPADDGVNPGGTPQVPSGVATTIHLYLDGGPVASPSDPCDQGSGDEVCAWSLTLVGQAGLSLVDFTASGDVVSNLGGNTLRATGLDPITGSLGPVKIGDLVVDGAEGGTLELSAGESIDAALVLEVLPPGTLVVLPEPGANELGLAGCAALLALAWRRRRAHRAGADATRLLAGALAVAAFGLGANPARAVAGVDGSCQCGDADGSEAVDDADVLEVREKLVGLVADVAAPGKCEVTPGGGCGLLDAVVIARDLGGQPPSIQQVCSVAATPACQDASSDVIDALNAAALLPDGPDVLGGIDDYALVNGRLRAVIDAPGLDPDSFGGIFPLANEDARTGGTLVDLASADTGNDQWVQMTQAVVGDYRVAIGTTGETDAGSSLFVDEGADFASDGVVAGDTLTLIYDISHVVRIAVGAVVNPTTLFVFVPPGTPYVDDFSQTLPYEIRRETSPLSNVVVYDDAELLDGQGLPVSSHAGDAVRLRLSGGVFVLDPLGALPTGGTVDPATRRLRSGGGSPIEVETTYTLVAGSRALDVETRVTNPVDGTTLSLDAISDRVSIGGAGGANLETWNGASGSFAQGQFRTLVTPFVGLPGRAKPGSSYAVVDVESGQLLHAADLGMMAIQTRLHEPASGFLAPGLSIDWRRSIVVGETNDAGAVSEAVRRLARSTDRLTPGGTTVPNPYGATAALSGTVSGASERTRVVAYQLSPGLLFDPGVPRGFTAEAGFYPAFFQGVPRPPIAFVTPDPTTGAYHLDVPSGFPGLAGGGPDELVVPPGLEGGLATSTYRVEVEHAGLSPLSQLASVTAGGGAVLDFDLALGGSMARVDLAVTDELAAPLPARVVIQGVDPDGIGPVPATPDPDLGDLPRASGQANAVHLAGGSGSVYLPPGSYRIHASRGLEYTLDRYPAPGSPIDHATLGAGQVVSVPLLLERVLDSAVLPEAAGVFASPLRRLVGADLRVHSAASRDAGVPAEDRVAAHLAGGVEVLVAADHDRLTDLGAAIAALDAAHPAADVASRVTSRTGVTSTGAVPIDIPVALELPNTAGTVSAWPLPLDPTARRRGAPADEYRHPAHVFDELRAAGAAVVALTTPRFPIPGPPLPPIGRGYFTNGKSGFPQPNSGALSLVAGGFPVPVGIGNGALGHLLTSRTPAGTANVGFDAIEIDSGLTLTYEDQAADWSALTSAGIVRTALAGSGDHDLVRAAGFPRTYVFAPGNASTDLAALGLPAFDAALLPRLVQQSLGANLPAVPRPGAGPDDMEVLGSSGPVVYLEVDADEDGIFEAQPGDLAVDDGDGSVDVRATVLAAPWVPVDSALLLVNNFTPTHGLAGGLDSFLVDLTVSLGSNPADPYSTDLADVVRLRETFPFTLPGGGDDWIAVEARGAVGAGSPLQLVVTPDGSAGLDEVVGFSNPIFIDTDGNGQFDPNGIP